ncbi:phage antirepressor KilAC domain-containing protein [Streptomyces sp. NPDC005799]|uniref:phage antirepressor KilAC domain-containing protein n=1 Tax=Streptomyces sp. NPDC005799 TaxID=3154678 RepID=UPI0033F41DBA
MSIGPVFDRPRHVFAPARVPPPGAWTVEEESPVSRSQHNAPVPAGNSGGSFEIGSFDFHGKPVIVLSNETGSWAVLGQLCQNLTLDSEAQRRAVLRKAWSRGKTDVREVMLPGQNRAYPQFLVHERIVPMWLANITSSRIEDPSTRANVEQAQVELADALHAYVTSRHTVREPTKLELARDLVVALEAREALEAENKVLAPKAGKWDAFMNSEGLIGMTAIADMLGVPVVDMTNWLVTEGVFRKQVSRFGSNKNMPRRTYQSSGHFAVKLETNGKVSYEVAYATVVGADFVFDRWQAHAAA